MKDLKSKILYFIIKINNDNIFAQSAQLAYYLILAFIPFLIFIMTIIGFSSLNSMQVLEGLKSILPNNVFELIEMTVVDVVDTQNARLLGISILVTMYSASSGIRAIIRGVNKAYDLHEHRSFIKIATIAIIFTVALPIMIMLALSLLVFGSLIGNYLIYIFKSKSTIILVWNISRYILVIVAMILIFACVYRFTPAKKVSWKEAFPGAIVSTLGWIIISSVFSYYINNIANYSRLYGSLGAVFIMMTWLYLTSLILILGAEINSFLSLRKINL